MLEPKLQRKHFDITEPFAPIAVVAHQLIDNQETNQHTQNLDIGRILATTLEPQPLQAQT